MPDPIPTGLDAMPVIAAASWHAVTQVAAYAAVILAISVVAAILMKKD